MYDDVTYVYDDVTYVYDDVTYAFSLDLTVTNDGVALSFIVLKLPRVLNK